MHLGCTARWLLLASLGVLSACGARAPYESTETRPGATGWSQRGEASWYGHPFHGRRTANGEVYDMEARTAAHRTLPFGSRVLVTNLENGRRTEVRINDRGPFVKGRIIDLSRTAARELDMLRAGVVPVKLSLLGPSGAPSSPSPTNSDVYSVQVGAFSDPQNARRLASDLRPRHPGVRVVTREGLHRVFAAQGLERHAAEALVERLESEGHQAFVVAAP